MVPGASVHCVPSGCVARSLGIGEHWEMSLDLGLLAADLRRDEGLRLKIYLDSVGVATVGFGHRCTPEDMEYYADGISTAIAESLLVEDISIALRLLDAELAWWRKLPNDAQRGMANMSYNLSHHLLGFTDMLAALQRGDFTAASKSALNSLWARQVGDRAKRIAALFAGCAPPPSAVS